MSEAGGPEEFAEKIFATTFTAEKRGPKIYATLEIFKKKLARANNNL
jgi:hypothetical protein